MPQSLRFNPASTDDLQDNHRSYSWIHRITLWTAVSMEAGTILAVVEISAKVLSRIAQYYSDVKGARQDRERLHKEVKALHDVLEHARRLVDGPNASKFPSLSSYINANCSPDIVELETKLNPGKGQRAMKKLGLRALKWPFDRKEVDDYINRFERHKSTINATVGIDQT